MLIWTVLLENTFKTVAVASFLIEMYGSLVARRIIVASGRSRLSRLRSRGWLCLQSNFFGALGQERFWVESHLKIADLLVDVVQVKQDVAQDTLQLIEDADWWKRVLLHVTVLALLLFLFPAIAGGTRGSTARAG